ncbi:hypothetical protein [Mesorhizobium hawassense]|uniref:hypothetical protein n=1 Tax=Mesorhizobium hawassense TaxID=1209954 RepID=UPI0011BE7867|nr:hypothetical protein [Mesorhizobium hawassense]
MDTLVIEVKPQYGHGWFIAGEHRFEVPAPFSVKVETSQLESSQPRVWTGIVLTEGHEFEGCRLTLTPRHVEWSGIVNILIEADRLTSGFGEIVSLPPQDVSI